MFTPYALALSVLIALIGVSSSELRASEFTVTYPRSGQLVVANATMSVFVEGTVNASTIAWWRLQGNPDWNRYNGSFSEHRLVNIPNHPGRVLEIGFSENRGTPPQEAALTGLRISQEGKPTAGFLHMVTFTQGNIRDTMLLMLRNESNLPVSVQYASLPPSYPDSTIYFVIDTIGLVVEPGQEYYARLRYNPKQRDPLDRQMGWWNAAIVTVQQAYTSEVAWRLTGTTSALEDSELGSINLTPNPASDVLTVDVPEYMVGSHLTVYLADGTLVLQSNVTSLSSMIDITMLPPGVYLVSLSVNGHTVTKTCVKY